MNVVPDISTEAYGYEDDCDCAAECLDVSVAEEQSTWNQTTIGYLLEECLKKKKDLHDPRHRRNKFFGDIREQMIARGLLFSVKELEKKFYNLKKHFYTICQNRDRAQHCERPITWPYYGKMLEIFVEELEIEDAPTMASLYPDPPLPKNLAIVEPKEREQVKSDHESDSEYEAKIIDDGSDGEEEARWSHWSVVAFLKECCRKKHELWDPQVRRRKIFTDIRHRLKAKGYHFYQESLDRKLRNMKKHFQVITETAQKPTDPTKRKQITWPYYEQLKEIYGAEMEKEVIRKRGRQPQSSVSQVNQATSATTLKFRPIAPKVGDHTDVGPIENQTPAVAAKDLSYPPQNSGLAPDFEEKSHARSSTVESGCVKLEKFEACSLSPTGGSHSQEDESMMDYGFATSDSPFLVHDDDSQQQPDVDDIAHSAKERLKFTLDILALEERRTVVAEQMLAELVESNKIREKRLEFNRIKLEFILARGKRKKNGSV